MQQVLYHNPAPAASMAKGGKTPSFFGSPQDIVSQKPDKYKEKTFYKSGGA